MEEEMAAPPSRKCEDLDANILAEIFGRLDITDRLLSIPFVCKPWKKAALLPRCWRILSFNKSYQALVRGMELTYHLDWCDFSGLLKVLLPRTQGSATHLSLPPDDSLDTLYSADDLELLANECPKLKLLALPWIQLEYYNQICKLIGKWKDLEFFSVRGNPNLVEELLRQIGSNCESFKALKLDGMGIDAEMAAALVMYTPGIEQLYLWNLRMDKKELLHILRGCKHLVGLSIKNCIGFNSDDEEILLSLGGGKGKGGDGAGEGVEPCRAGGGGAGGEGEGGAGGGAVREGAVLGWGGVVGSSGQSWEEVRAGGGGGWRRRKKMGKEEEEDDDVK